MQEKSLDSGISLLLNVDLNEWMLFYPLLLNSYCFSCKLFGVVTSYFEFVQGAEFQLALVSTGKKENNKQKYVFEGMRNHQKSEK